MKVMTDFNCPTCGRTHERYCSTDVQESKCECGELAFRVIAGGQILKDGKFRFSLYGERWAKERVARYQKRVSEGA